MTLYAILVYGSIVLTVLAALAIIVLDLKERYDLKRAIPHKQADGDCYTTLTVLAPPALYGLKTYRETYLFISEQAARASRRYFAAMKERELVPWYRFKPRYMLWRYAKQHMRDSFERSNLAEDYRKAMLLAQEPPVTRKEIDEALRRPFSENQQT